MHLHLNIKEKIQQLEVLLNEIMKLIDLHRQNEQIDLEEFDSINKIPLLPEIDKNEDRERNDNFRNVIVSHKTNKAFWNYEILKLQSLLTTTQDENFL